MAVKVHTLAVVHPIHSAVIVHRGRRAPTNKQGERRPAAWTPPPPWIPITDRFCRVPTAACPPPVIEKVVMIPPNAVPDFDPPFVAKIRYVVPEGVPWVGMT